MIPEPVDIHTPTAMHPALSSWLKNMDELSRRIHRLQKIASATPEDLKRKLNGQVDSLHTAFLRQRQRYFEFLRLTEEYAHRYFLDISTEIDMQSSLLEELKKRLVREKELRDQAHNLRRSYESGTKNITESVRKTGEGNPHYFQIGVLT